MTSKGMRNAVIIVVAFVAFVIGIAVPVTRTPAPIRVPVAAATAPTQTGRIAPVPTTFAQLWAQYPAECEYEDSLYCRWNASEDGNGMGTSFVSIERDGHVVTYRADGTVSVY
jgi:hypothetical protein